MIRRPFTLTFLLLRALVGGCGCGSDCDPMGLIDTRAYDRDPASSEAALYGLCVLSADDVYWVQGQLVDTSNLCEARATDDQCMSCARDSCCAEAEGCMGDDLCRCRSWCETALIGTPEECSASFTCDLPGPEDIYRRWVACLGANCECPRLAGAPGGSP
jgi:hypothetical protein